MPDSLEQTGDEVDEWFTADARLRLAAGLSVLIVLSELAISVIDLVTEAIIHFLLLGIGLYVVLTLVEILRAELATK